MRVLLILWETQPQTTRFVREFDTSLFLDPMTAHSMLAQLLELSFLKLTVISLYRTRPLVPSERNFELSRKTTYDIQLTNNRLESLHLL